MNDTSQFYETDDLRINHKTQQVTKKNVNVKLTHLSYKTLITLITNAPNSVSVDQLIDQVWGDIQVSSETVTQRIALVRKSLAESNESNEKYIASIRNQGYRWVPDVKTSNQNNHKKNLSKLLTIFFVIIFSVVLLSLYMTDKTSSQNSIILNKQSKDEYLSQARHYLNKHDLPSNKIAIELYRKSLAINAENVEAMIGISFALSHQVSKYNQPHDLLDEAKDLAKKAIATSPSNANALVALGFVYDASGEIDKAIGLYEKGIELNSENASAKSSLAYLYIQKGRLVEAMQLNISAIGSKQLYLNLQIANTLELLGFDAVAEHWYQKADELSPDNVFATHQRARFYISHDQNSKAKEVIESAMNRGIQRPELNVLLGIIELMNKDLGKASLNYKNALKVDANDFEANLWSFIVSQDIQTTDTDKQEFEKYWFEETPSWPNVEVFKALYLAHNNRFEEAIVSIEKAYNSGYVNHRWLKKLPPFYPIKDHPQFMRIIENMQNDISKQRQELLNADWLPISFLDPQKF
jgi:DNA-binding winged helix-turn-helix (wHTH) protein/Tfp pilus assembly protein PilF